MKVSVGIDIASGRHWVTALGPKGHVWLDGLMERNAAAFAGLASELLLLGSPVFVVFDAAAPPEVSDLRTILSERGFALFAVPVPARMVQTADRRDGSPRVARFLAETARRGRGEPVAGD